MSGMLGAGKFMASEPGELVVPRGVGFFLGLERLDGAHGECHPEARSAFFGRRC